MSSERHHTSRFFAFEEIATDSVLHLDESVHLTSVAHIESAYEVWANYSDRLVRFNTSPDEVDQMPYFLSSYYNHYYADIEEKGTIVGSADRGENLYCENALMDVLVQKLTSKHAVVINNFEANRNLFKNYEVKVSANCLKHLGEMRSMTLVTGQNFSSPCHFIDHSGLMT